MNALKSLALSSVVLAFSASAIFAQSPVEMRDTNAKFTMQLGGGIA